MPDTIPATTPILPRPPMPSRRLTQLETLRAIRRNPIELWGEAAFTQPVLAGRLLGRHRVLLNSPQAIRHVLLDNVENYGRTPASRRVLGPILGQGLLLAEGNDWRLQRRTVAPALAPRMMPMLCRHIARAAEEAEAALHARIARGEDAIDLYAVLQHLTLTIAGRSMFSLEMDAHGERLRALVHRYTARHGGVRMLDMMLPPRIPSPADLGRFAFRAEWRRFMGEIVAARAARDEGAARGARDEGSAEEAPSRDLYDMLRAARDPETGQGFTPDQLRDEISTLILAGYDTTTVALFWSCYLAVLFPEQQERIAAEAAPLDLSPEGAAAAEGALPETRAHLEETMRLYPPAFAIMREALGPDRLPGVDVEVGPRSVITIAPWVLHRHRTLWEDPERFDRTRFLPGAPAPDRFAYMPFGAGPRICVGARFAMAEAMLVLARLLRSFRLEFAADPAVVPVGRVIVQPDRRVPFRLVPRG